ncbi:MAG TPA: ferric iron uptake transcriptional regulator [Gammaproteobacteria bacterium]|nr:ferric iron uptake transcriptional regulator [Gammaproteobacteria bacterium]
MLACEGCAWYPRQCVFRQGVAAVYRKLANTTEVIFVESLDLKKAGLKATLPRIKILEILEKNRDAHLRAEDVYKALLESGEDVGLATVYRVLTQFEAAGLVSRHHFEGGHAVFELDQGEHHDHILCIGCGRVDEFVDDLIEQRQRDIATKAGYSMTDHSLYIYGLCEACRKEKKQ